MKYITFLCAVILLSLFACQQIPDKQTVKIGVILPLTGANAIAGTKMKMGIDFVKHSSKSNKIEYQVIYEDDQYIPSKTALAAQKLINVDKVDVLLTPGSQPAAIVAPLVESKEILHLSYSSDKAFTKYKGNYSFAQILDDITAFLLTEIKRRGYKKIALISAVEVFANLIEENIKESVSKYDLEIVYDEKIIVGTRDFKTILLQAEEKKPDIYIIQTWLPEIDILTKQLKEVNADRPITSMFSFFHSTNRDLYEGQFLLGVEIDNPEFKDKFYSHYNEASENMVYIGYGMLDFALHALKEKGPEEEWSDEIMQRAALKSHNILGQLNFINKTIFFPPRVIEIRNGRLVAVEN